MAKKLLQINASVNTGSIGRISEQIGLKAMEQGWESYIAYGRPDYLNLSKSKLIKVGRMVNVYEHYLENRFFDNEGLASRIPTKRFIRQIEEIKPDIIHLHNIHDHWLNYKILFEYLNTLDTPIVWTQHDCWAFTGGCMHFVHTNCDKWRIECCNCPRSNKFVDKSREQFNLKKSLFVENNNLVLVPVSHWLENEMKHSFFKGHKIVPILNGVDINVFKPLNKINIKEKYKIGNRFVLMGLATAWSERKGFNDYIELSKHIGDDEVIVLVGLKKEQFQKLPSNVIGIERTSNVQELVELYSIADIVLNLSYGETFGLTTVEGFACGIPGIVYDRTASPELIDEGVGYVVEAGNMKQLLNAINLIKQKGKAYYSENCRKRAECNYDKDRIFNEYIELYNNLLNNKK